MAAGRFDTRRNSILRGSKMRGFKKAAQANSPVLGEVAYQNFIKVAKIKSDKTEDAKRWFKTPPYYFEERKQNDRTKVKANI